MANINTKRNRKLTGFRCKRGKALNTSVLREASGKQPYRGGKKEAIRNGVLRP